MGTKLILLDSLLQETTMKSFVLLLAGLALLTPLSSAMDLKETVKKMDAIAGSFKALNQKYKDFINEDVVVVPDPDAEGGDDDESIEIEEEMYEDPEMIADIEMNGDPVYVDMPLDDMPMDDMPKDDMPMDDMPMNDMPMDDMPMDDMPVEEDVMEDYPEEGAMKEEAEQEARRRSGRRRWG